MLIFIELEYPKMNAEIQQNEKVEDDDTMAEKLFAYELFQFLTQNNDFLSSFLNIILELFFRKIRSSNEIVFLTSWIKINAAKSRWTKYPK